MSNTKIRTFIEAIKAGKSKEAAKVVSGVAEATARIQLSKMRKVGDLPAIVKKAKVVKAAKAKPVKKTKPVDDDEPEVIPDLN